MGRKFSKSKKADLSISTNAIVVLIIAVVMLGLIIAFIKTMFGNITDDIKNATELEIEPDAPRVSEPFTISREVINTKPKKWESLKMRVLNPTENNWPTTGTTETYTPVMSCRGEQGDASSDISREVLGQHSGTWPSKTELEFVYSFQVDKNALPDTVYNCKIQMMRGCTQADADPVPVCASGTATAVTEIPQINLQLKIGK